jgi:hypothetical protein
MQLVGWCARLNRDEAAIHQEFAAGHEPAVVGRQEQHGSRNFIQFSATAQRGRLLQNVFRTGVVA